MNSINRRDYLKLMGAAAAAPGLSWISFPFGDEPAAGKEQRLKWWREARFGMFIHWGLYAIPAGEWKGRKTKSAGEWILNDLQIPLAEYTPLVQQFNPVKYDAREWVRIAKDAGMKYLVITSKHHDGFALFDSKVSDYDVMATPYHKDILRPLSEECKKAGIRFCTYHSIMDWHHPDYVPRRKWDARPTTPGSLDKYVKYMKEQLREIVNNYNPGVMWFDGEWEDTWTHERGVDLYDYVRGLNPKIIINNRVDKGRQGMQGLTKAGDFKGDFGTPEQEIPPNGLPGVDWESCMTMNNTWGFKKDDGNWKSDETLIRNLIDIASKGGNFLLNVGPTPEGLIPGASVERLAAMGKWMKLNGQSIYGTSASVIGKPAWGRCTSKAGRLYLHVFDWPKNGKLEVSAKVAKAHLLTSPGVKLKVTPMAAGATIQLPAQAPDPIASVIVADLKT